MLGHVVLGHGCERGQGEKQGITPGTQDSRIEQTLANADYIGNGDEGVNTVLEEM